MSRSILTINSIAYTLKHLFNIANPNHNLKYDFEYDSEDCKVTVSFEKSKKKIIINLVSSVSWYELTDDKNGIKWIDNIQINHIDNIGYETVPVMFWKNNSETFVDILNENEIVFNADIISSSLFMLSRWEEIIDKRRDEHGRFTARQSIAYRHDFLNIPVVDVYAMILRKYLQLLFPKKDLGHRKFSVRLSHDIDEVRRFPSLMQTVKSIIGGDLIKRKSIVLALSSLKQAIKTLINVEEDPYIKGIYQLAEISWEYNLNSSFYFKTSRKSNYDSGYKIDTIIKHCIEKLVNNGFEIGFHPGYNTFENYKEFIREKNEIDKILDSSSYGGRQHFLRFDVPTTWIYWEKAGLKYDSTMVYADHEGFRCGTCHPFKPYDIECDRELDILEIPLIVMDVTLNGYRRLTPEQGFKCIVDLAQKCKKVEGDFTLLWHNVSIYREWEQWFKMYKEVVKYLSGIDF